MRTLSAAWTALLAQPTGSLIWVVRIYSGGTYWPGSKAYYTFTTRAVGWTPNASEVLDVGRLRPGGIRAISHQLDENAAGGVADSTEVEIEIDALGGFAKSLEALGFVFEGRKVSIQLSHSSLVSQALDLDLFVGIITDVRVGPEMLLLRIESMDQMHAAEKLPPRIWDPADTSDAVADDSFVPTEIRGKPIPLVFGAHDMVEGYTLAPTYNDGSADRGKIVQFADVNWMVGATIGSLSSLRWGDSGLSAATGGFASVNGATGKTVYTVMAAKDKLYFEAIEQASLYLKFEIFPTAFVLNEANLADVTGQKNAIDDDLTNYCRIPAQVTNQQRYASYKLPFIGIGGTVEGSASDPGYYAIMKVTPASSGWLTDGDYWHGWAMFLTKYKLQGCFGSDTFSWYQRAGIESPEIARNNFSNRASWSSFQFVEFGGGVTWENYDTLSDLSGAFLGVGIWNDGMVANSPVLDLYGIGLRVYCLIDWPGRGFYAWMDGYSDHAGLITGTVGAPIMNPAHIASYILSYLSRAGDSVDCAGFSAVAAGARSGWAFANQIKDEQVSLFDVLGEIGKESLCWFWVDHWGRWRCVPMTTPTREVDAQTIEPADVERGQFESIRQTDIEEMATSFKFRYKPNPVTGSFDGSLICNSTDASPALVAAFSPVVPTALCATAQSRYSTDGPKSLEVDLSWVRTEATAVSAAKKVISRCIRKRWILEWTSHIGLLAWELGDPLRLRAGAWIDLPTSIQSAYYRIVKKEVDPATATIRWVAVEVAE